MKTVISVRLSSYPGSPAQEFFRGSESTVRRKIVNLIDEEPDGGYDILIDEDGKKYIKKSAELVGQTIPIAGGSTVIEFAEDMITIRDVDKIDESLPQKRSVDQWKKLRRATKGIDIGDRISDMNKEGSNIHYVHNPVDSGIESIQDYEKSNKDFKPNKNLKHLSSFESYNK